MQNSIYLTIFIAIVLLSIVIFLDINNVKVGVSSSWSSATSSSTSELAQRTENASQIYPQPTTRPKISQTTSQNPTTRFPGITFLELFDRPDLGIKYTKTANIISSNQRYAVITADTIRKGTPISYFFNLPFTCLGWKNIGYGCFIILPYVEEDSAEDSAHTKQAIKLVKQNLIKFMENDKQTGSVIIMDLKVDKNRPEKLVQVAQVIRLFVGNLVKYTLVDRPELDDTTQNEILFNKIKNSVYIITSDVDFIPLSTKIYHYPMYDFSLMNGAVGNIKLSCIGASLAVWEFLHRHEREKSSKTGESEDLYEYDEDHIYERKSLYEKSLLKTNHFNSSAIIEMSDKDIFKNNQQVPYRDNQPSKQKLEWYMDQSLATKLLKKFANEFGLNKIHQQSSAQKNLRRGDRKMVAENTWSQFVDDFMANREDFKDSHFCRANFGNECWWSFYNLLKRLLSSKDLEILVDYRIAFIKLMLKYEFLGTKKENSLVREEDTEREKYLKSFNGALDIRKEWSQFYPNFYKFVRPDFVDWAKERVFRNVIKNTSKGRGSGKVADIYYYLVVPKKPDLLDETLDKLLCKNSQFLIRKLKDGESCDETLSKEMFFQK